MEGDHTSQDKATTYADIQYIKDFPFPASARFRKENILSALNYSPLDDDLIINSYPKTGTTWVEYIILQILYKGEKYPTMVELNHQLVPYMERAGAAAAEKLVPPRFVKFHLPYHLIPYNEKAKYIYVVRNPKDIVVSYYHFRREMGDEIASFDDFFERFMSGRIAYGNYLEHLGSWLPHKGDNNVLFICYEKLHADVKAGALRIAKFLGDEYYNRLKGDDELMDQMLKKTSFEYMSKNIELKRPLVNPLTDKAETERKSVKFFRKGKPGDWRNYLSPEQVRRLDATMEEVLKDSALLSLWKS